MNHRDPAGDVAVARAPGWGWPRTPAAGQSAGDGRTLVAFLSRSGNTRVIAGQLQRRFGADLFEIRTAEPYPADYEETVARAERERDAAATPALAEGVADIGGYETVFLGFPIWGMALPAPVQDLPRDARPRGQDARPVHHPRRLRHRRGARDPGRARAGGADRDALRARGGSGARDHQRGLRLARDRRAGALSKRRRP